jgi:hypothetical protein
VSTIADGYRISGLGLTEFEPPPLALVEPLLGVGHPRWGAGRRGFDSAWQRLAAELQTLLAKAPPGRDAVTSVRPAGTPF